MKEKLIIKNFGPIKDVELVLSNFNVLIGDQGTGKSTVSKLYSLIYNYAYYDVFDVKDSHDPNTLKFFRNLELFGILNYLESDSEIKFQSSTFVFEFAEGIVKTPHPKLYEFSFSEFSEKMKNNFHFDYIVAERVLVSTLADALYGLNELGTKLPTLFNRFGNKFSSARKEKVRWEYMHLLRADFSHVNGIDSILLENGKILPFSDASTGMQSAMPMLIVFDSVIEKIRNEKKEDLNHLIVFEELELNLFPGTQREILNYIVSNSMNESTFKAKMIVNTHSPYILTSLNNLMYAYEVGGREPEMAEEIVNRKYWINPEEVSAYRLLTDGTCKKIISSSENGTLIEADEIDEVSRGINMDFDELIRVDMLNEERK